MAAVKATKPGYQKIVNEVEEFNKSISSGVSIQIVTNWVLDIVNIIDSFQVKWDSGMDIVPNVREVINDMMKAVNKAAEFNLKYAGLSTKG